MTSRTLSALVMMVCVFAAGPIADALAQDLTNLGYATGPRFTLTDKTWPASPGDADVCLWKDDAHAAVSITIDVTGGLLDWWQSIGDTYDIGVTWFVITDQMDNDPYDRYPDWTELAAIHANGHDIQSHSVTHLNTTLGFDPDDPLHDHNVEYRDSKAAIETNLGIPCLTIAYPGGSGFGNYPDLAMNYYIAGRGTVAKVNPPNEIDYPETRSIGNGLVIDEPTSTWNNLSNLFNPSHYGWRGWYVCHFHGLDEARQAEVVAGLDYLQIKDAEVGIWNCWYRHGAQYAQERDSATLTTDSVTPDKITLTLTDLMRDSLFDYPLTVKVRLHEAWTEVYATQDGEPVDAALITHDGGKFALVQAIPDRGAIELTPTETSNAIGGDADGDGDVDLDDFVILKSSFGTPSGATQATGDFDGDGDVDLDDFVILKTNFGYVPPNDPPSANAGSDQALTDADEDGSEVVTLDGSASADTDGSIVSYVWEGAASPIAAGVSPTVTLPVAVHTIDLTVTDDDGATDTDSVVITVNAPTANVAPTANAGADRGAYDNDDSGAEDVALDGSGSSDSDGMIASYVWDDGAAQIATGETPTVALAVGSYTVTLTVTDDDGATDTDTVDVTVHPVGTGAVYVVNGHTDDTCMRVDGTFRAITQKDNRAGDDNAGVDGAYVMVFQLPTLAAGETVTDANLDVVLVNLRSGMIGNVDLYGLPYRSASAVIAADYYQGVYAGDVAATALQDDICVLTTPLGPVASDAVGDSNIAAYLNAQYAAGAQGGDYVFLRLSPDVDEAPNYQYYAFASANADDAGTRPVLTITTGQ